jgi:CxxC motif-containing protein (DUF1111 family)
MAGAVPPEGQAIFAYGEREVRFADGEAIRLRVPRVTFMQLAFGPLGDQTMTSPRIAPAMVGLGLLEAVPEATLLDIARRQEADGISGRPNVVWDVERRAAVIGRFGWKANQPTLRQQVAAAFHGDIGATTFLFPDENCPPAQRACRELPAAIQCSGLGACQGDAFVPEVIPSRLDNITFYLRKRWLYRRAATPGILRCGTASNSSRRPDATCAMRLCSRPVRLRGCRPRASRSVRTRTSCCTTWATTSRTIDRISWRMVANGGRLREG